MAKKIKLLWCGDINKSTGFGKVADNLIPRLLETGRYEMVAMGINYRGVKVDYGFQIYGCDSSDPYGFNLFPIIVQQEKPDVVFIIQDLFAAFQYTEFLRRHAPNTASVLYFPIDGDSTPPQWLQCIRDSTVPVPYSEYARKMIAHRLPEVRDTMRVIYHGIDTSKYRPFSEEERTNNRKKSHTNDKFVVGIVNRFQPRKLIPMGVRAFTLFSKGYKKCSCGNYYLPSLDECDLNFCKSDKVVEQCPGHDDALLYLHMNPIEPLIGGNTNTMDMIIQAAGLTHEDANKKIIVPGVDVLNPITSPTEDDVISMYNMLDVYVATDCGEGYGLTQMEALSCGIPVIKSNNTTAPELLQEYGLLARSAAHFSMGYDSGHFRPVVSIPAVVDHLEDVYKTWVANGRKTIPNKEAHAYVTENFSWTEKAQQFDEAIQDAVKIINQPKIQSSDLVVVKV